jgi:glutaredoxin-dependent peroxiredoxin
LSRFRDDAAFYDSNNAQILGISVDSIYAQRAFSERLGGLPFPLLPDFNKIVFAKYSGLYENIAGMKGVGKRAVYVIDKSGIVRYKWIAEAPGQAPNYEEVKQAAAALT